jgi:hypothetical protein
MTRRLIPIVSLASLIVAAAVAQSSGQQVIIERAGAAPARQEGLVRVQLSIQLFVAGPTDESAEAEKQRERARRAVYDLAAKECDLMRDAIARDCRLESVNVNLNRQASAQMQGYMVSGNMAYQITLK